MGCNAWNHDINCSCNFRGGHGFGGGGRRFSAVAVEPALPGWSRSRSGGTVASYVNTNARCPECGARVIFSRSPYDGRVFFDPPLGPPWPKHWCTDSRRWNKDSPRPAAGNVLAFRPAQISVAPPKRETSLNELGWEPLGSAKTYVKEGRTLLTGDVQGKFSRGRRSYLSALSAITPIAD
jgi:hypothetical protein